MSINIDNILNKTVLVGLSYFDKHGQLLQQRQLSGVVVESDEEKGIAIKLTSQISNQGQNQQSETPEHFVLPSSLNCWFKAPPGHYKNPQQGVDIENPDFLVTWDIHQKQEEVEDGTHQWWEWVPNTVSPQVNSPNS